MKTAKQWFEEVKEPRLKRRLIEVWNNNCRVSEINTKYSNIFDALISFRWENSKEEYDFWNTIFTEKSFDHFYTKYKAKKITKVEINTGQIPVVLLAKKIEDGDGTTTGVKLNQGKLPYYTVLFEQFPLAIQALVKRSEYGHQKYIEFDKNYDNWKNVDNAPKAYRDALIRHLFEDGELHESKVDHLTAALWNCCAILQLELENDKKTVSKV